MRETNAAQMLYVIIFMDHTIALVKKAIMEMAKTAEVRLSQFSSFPFLLFGESALRLLPSSDGTSISHTSHWSQPFPEFPEEVSRANRGESQ